MSSSAYTLVAGVVMVTLVIIVFIYIYDDASHDSEDDIDVSDSYKDDMATYTDEINPEEEEKD